MSLPFWKGGAFDRGMWGQVIKAELLGVALILAAASSLVYEWPFAERWPALLFAGAGIAFLIMGIQLRNRIRSGEFD
ncbi:MAG: hypothetical protein M3R70_01770 [Actinomycetota bacterium]|nr:hypothetical protein [Actinomycetota bacterium]